MTKTLIDLALELSGQTKETLNGVNVYQHLSPSDPLYTPHRVASPKKKMKNSRK